MRSAVGSVVVAALMASLMPAAAAHAELGNQSMFAKGPCLSILGECFAKDPDERTECFYSSAEHPFCYGTNLGRLAMRRWSCAATHAAAAPAVGRFSRQLVDQLCLEQFDSRWAAYLLRGEMSRTVVSALALELEQCVEEVSLELTRF